jgi:hypothetical protein
MSTLVLDFGTTVSYGSRTISFEGVGKTIGELRKRLAKALGIPDGAMVLVDGNEASDDRVMSPTDRDVEFVKESGRLG